MKLYKAKISELSDSDYKKAISEMPEKRRNAVLRFRSEDDRKRTVLGEILAVNAIADRLGLEKKDIVFERTEKGKPFAVGLDVGFSISHSEDMVICAVSEHSIGADIEKIRPLNMRITRAACNESDLEYIFGAGLRNTENTEHDRDILKRFFEIWTAKEAYFKYTGSGIADMKALSYKELLPFCRVEENDVYIITVYSPEDVI